MIFKVKDSVLIKQDAKGAARESLIEKGMTGQWITIKDISNGVVWFEEIACGAYYEDIIGVRPYTFKKGFNIDFNEVM